MDGWARLERKPLVRNGLKKARALRALARSNGRTMADERRSRRFHTKRWTPRTGTDGGSRMRDRERPTTGRAIAGTAPADRLAATGVVHQYDTDSLGKHQASRRVLQCSCSRTTHIGSPKWAPCNPRGTSATCTTDRSLPLHSRAPALLLATLATQVDPTASCCSPHSLCRAPHVPACRCLRCRS